MTEATLKAKLVEGLRHTLKPWVVLRHEDRITGGIPDISVTGHRKTTWWEVKHANPRFECVGIQQLTALRLDAMGSSCYFIIYATRKDRTSGVYIVRPQDLANWQSSTVYADGYDHKFVVEFVRGVQRS